MNPMKPLPPLPPLLSPSELNELEKAKSGPTLPSVNYPDLVEGLIQCGEVTLIGGSRGVGKTAFDSWMRSVIGRGETFLGHATNQPPWWGAIILDRGIEDRQQWCDAAEIELPPHYCMMDDMSIIPLKIAKLDKDGAFAYLESWLNHLKPPPGAFISIDPANFFSGDDRYSYFSAIGCGLQLSKIAKERQIGILAYMHGGKQKKFDGYMRLTDRIIGSTGFLGAVGTVCYLASRQESKELGELSNQVFIAEPHHGTAICWSLARTNNGLFEPSRDISDILNAALNAEGEEGSEKGERFHPSEKDIRFLSWLKENGGEIIDLDEESFGWSRMTFYRVQRRLKEHGLIEVIRKGGHVTIRLKKQPSDS